MNTKKLLVALTFVLAVAVIAPVVAYMSDAPGTIVDPKSFVFDSFKSAMLSDEPGSIVDPKSFAIDSFKTALLSDEPGTVVDPAAFVVDTIVV